LKPNPSSTPANEPKGVELPRSAENPPAPQLKDSNPGSLVSAVQVDRASTPSAAAESSGDYGQQEYQQAMQILRAPNREAETPEAVRLLWIAVEKGNTSGEVALAELYRRGRGVVKNCDQARILLSAASRKGSADAQKHLEELQREGCTE
jgi:TPR repeat protein